MIRSLFFDFDGTLSDSSEGIYSSALKTMEHFGYDTSIYAPNDLKKFIGPPIGDCFRLTFNSKEEEIPSLVEYFRVLYKTDGMYRMKVYPGIKEMLSVLKNKGFTLVVATSKIQSIIIKCLENLDLDRYFSLVCGSLTDSEKKCDVINRAVDTLSIKKNEVVMIGDTENDKVGAENAAVGFIPVLWGFGYNEKNYPKKYKVASSPEDIIKIATEWENMKTK